MPESQKNNPLHGVRLDRMLTDLVDYYGWNKLGLIIDIKCFNENPTMSSSLKFLRTTPWARKKVENLYLEIFVK